jgi:hypothetical protein
MYQAAAMSLLLLLSTLSFAEDVVVTSNLEGATIFVDGKDTGQVTPATLHGLRPGSVTVSVREGCTAGSAIVKVTSGQATKVSLFAIEGTGLLTVRPSPADAHVTIDGKPLAKVGQKVELACGEHRVEATRDGYAPEVVTIQVEAEQKLELPIELQKADLANLELSVQPRTALLMVDGKEVGTDTVTLPSVAPGSHTIGAEYTGYQSVEQTIKVRPGDDLAWHFELVRNATRTKSSATQIRGPAPEVLAAEEAAEKTAVADAQEPGADLPEAGSEEGEEDTSVPYYLREEAKQKAEKAAKPEKAAKTEKPAKAEKAEKAEKAPGDEDLDSGAAADEATDGRKKKTGLRVTGGVFTGLGVAGGVGTFFLYDSANVAHDAWLKKDEAAHQSGDSELIAKAKDYHDEVFIPRATMFYGGAGVTAALLGTGVILFVVDAPVTPMIVPGGGLLSWHGSF